MQKLFHHQKYNEALFPRVGLIVEFQYETQLLGYVSSFFDGYFKGSAVDYIENLRHLGIIKTVVRSSFLNEAESIHFTLDCHYLLQHLGLIENTKTEDNLQLYTIQEVAKILAVTRQTVYNLINLGYFNPIQLKGIKGQRIAQSDIRQYLNNK
ncbi:helix-turn-helix domain-containing protein [Pontibacter harenae]|uniref:helix-turn-helix domain-containing protein n=1 Tax=Pontibacter harenae TaxID=2894083 RepID=UPI001E50C896|nr:helix-turn-helix domain-containing protein [Pontibacter harenae]MCC9167431.1 helix-turn-helix domain-containing protein [Pontibacter harenae]